MAILFIIVLLIVVVCFAMSNKNSKKAKLPAQKSEETSIEQKVLNENEQYATKAKSGDPEAMLALAKAYDAAKEYKHAAEWYLKAAMQGNIDAEIAISMRYAVGHGFDRNLDEAERWLAKSEQYFKEQSIQPVDADVVRMKLARDEIKRRRKIAQQNSEMTFIDEDEIERNVRKRNRQLEEKIDDLRKDYAEKERTDKEKWEKEQRSLPIYGNFFVVENGSNYCKNISNPSVCRHCARRRWENGWTNDSCQL